MWTTLPSTVRQDIAYDRYYATRGARAWTTANDPASDLLQRELAGETAARCHEIIADRARASLALEARVRAVTPGTE